MSPIPQNNRLALEQDLSVSLPERVPFCSMSRPELDAVAQRLSSDFEALREVRVPIVETLLQAELLSADDLRDLVPRLTETERGELGAYIGRCLPPCKYLEAFHDCWEHIDYETRSKLTRRFVKDEPQHALMVAPFVNLTKQFVSVEPPIAIRAGERPHEFQERLSGAKKERGASVDGKLECVLVKTLSSYDDASRLMAVCLRSASRNILEAVTEHLTKSAPMFLTPYAPELIERGILSAAALDQILLRGPRNYSGDFSRIFWTKDDIRAEKDLTEHVQRVFPKARENPGDTWMWPERYAAALSEIYDRVSLRRARHILGSLEDMRPHLGNDRNVTEYLTALLDRAVPVFSQLPELGFAPARISRLAARGQEEVGRIVMLSNFGDIKGLVEAGAERTAIRAIIEELSEGTSSSVVRDMARQLPEVLSWLSPPVRERLVGYINGKAPEIWIRHLDHAIENGYVSPRQILTSISSDEYKFVEWYPKLRNALRSREQRGATDDLTAKEVNEKAEAFLEKHPALIFRRSFVDQIMGPEEQDAFLTARLRGDVDKELLFAAVTKLDRNSRLGRHDAEIRKALMDNPGAILRFAEWEWWKDLEPYLDKDERFALLTKAAADSGVRSIVNGSDVIKDAITTPRCFAKLLAEVCKPDNIRALPRLVEEVFFVRERLLGKSCSQDEIGRAEQSIAMLEAASIEACQMNEHLVFAEGMLENFGGKMRPLLEAEAGRYASCNPHELGRLLEHLPSELAGVVALDHARSLAILRTRDNEALYRNLKLSPELTQRMAELSPLERVARLRPEPPDFYGALLGELRMLPHFEIFGQRLEALVKREERENGPRPVVREYSMNGEILAITEHLAFLASSPAACAHVRTILSFPERERAEVCGLLELSAMCSLDDGLEEISNLAEVVDVLRERLAGHMARVFDLPSLEAEQLMGMDVELLRAMSIYYRGACSDEERMAKTFRRLIGEAVTGRYSAWRAWGLPEEPEADDKEAAIESMRAEGLLPRRLTLRQYEAWLRDESFEVEASLDYDMDDVAAGIRRVLRQAVTDRHVDAAELELSMEELSAEYERLVAPLAGRASRKNDLVREIKTARRAGLDVSELEEEFRTVDEEIREHLAENEQRCAVLRAKMSLATLREGRGVEIESGRLKVGRWRVPLKEIFPALESEYGEKYPDFMADLGQIRIALDACAARAGSADRVSVCSMRVTDAVDLRTHFMIGKRPVESCQHFDSRGDLNGGLLSYVTDPSVKILQTYDDSGKIVARAVLRLLEDDNGRPQLFLERLYSSNPHPRIFDGMVDLAKRKAAAIGAGLYSHSAESNEELCEGGSVANLHSRGSRSLYVYSDAAGGLQTHGRYTISGAIRIANSTAA